MKKKTGKISRIGTNFPDKLEIMADKKLFKSNMWSPKYKNLDGFKKALNETYDWFKKDENLKKYTNIKNYNI